MPSDDSNNRNSELLEAQLNLLNAARAGKLENLACPKCGRATVSIWFTQPVKNQFRTWFVCENCDYEFSAQNSGLPPYYSVMRDRTAKLPAT
jgi:hypothetical protein